MESIITIIKNIKFFDLRKYYELIEKYGEKNVVKAFSILLTNSKNTETKVRILQKYYSAYITMDIENSIVDKNTYKKFCNKYGEDNVNKYIIECEEIGSNSKVFDNISLMLDFLVKDEEENGEDINYKSNNADVNDYIVDPVHQYLKEINQIPMLSADEEREIFIKYTNETDEKKKIKIRNQIAEANFRLVVSIAKMYVKNNYPLLDVIQDGNIGLMKAVDKYDFSKGYKFSTYATWWIKQAITRALSEKSRIIRLPVHVCELIKKISSNRINLTYELGREPTDEELAKSLGITVDKFKEINMSVNEPVSLQAPVGNSDDLKNDTLGSFIPDDNVSIEEDYIKVELKEYLKTIISNLNPREQKVIKLRFGLDNNRCLTLEEVGDILGVTRERVRQVESKCLRRLKRKLKNFND